MEKDEDLIRKQIEWMRKMAKENGVSGAEILFADALEDVDDSEIELPSDPEEKLSEQDAKDTD